MKIKKIIISIIISTVCITLFILSHKTYYKYNDWAILGNSIDKVREKYGEFDYGKIKNGKSGVVGYYIYTDNSPVMPDYLPRYYYIHYDINGTVDRVYVVRFVVNRILDKCNV